MAHNDVTDKNSSGISLVCFLVLGVGNYCKLPGHLKRCDWGGYDGYRLGVGLKEVTISKKYKVDDSECEKESLLSWLWILI
jgi:hypothetical protein